MKKCKYCKKNRKHTYLNTKRYSTRKQIWVFSYVCRECNNNQKRNHYKLNSKKILLKRRENPKYQERIKKHYYAWVKRNPVKAREIRKKYIRRKYHNDDYYRMNKNIASSVCRYIRGVHNNNKSRALKWEKLTGMSSKELKIHLESKFYNNMNWNNYGVGGWEIDHIISKSKFNISTIKDCWSLENLQPLWGKDNFDKYRKERFNF